MPIINDTVEEMGQQVLAVLHEKKFIKSWIHGIWCMEENVQNFVKARAKEMRFFNFDESNGELTPQVSGSQRACLLKSQDHFPSSCKLWLNNSNSVEKLESLKEICTLLYVNEPVVGIKMEWFSYMRNLLVLHLVNLDKDDKEQIDVVDFKFLEELKNMKQLRLFSLQGFAALRKLPSSICKITNLRILNLGYCTNLEELPADIGSLQNLTHMDLTQCHLLSELPKGVKFLSKLEVLKGFIITYKANGRQNTKACTLRELKKLLNLRKLSLVVNQDRFPDCEDLEVFKEMNNLCNLKITWTRNYDEEQEEPNEQEALRQSRWQKLICWMQQSRQSDIEEPLTRSRLDNLRKLVLCCFPFETAPDWVHQSELQKLEKLYIVGGNLKTLPGNAWNSIKKVQLKYLPNLEADDEIFKQIFPNFTSTSIYNCSRLENVYF